MSHGVEPVAFSTSPEHVQRDQNANCGEAAWQLKFYAPRTDERGRVPGEEFAGGKGVEGTTNSRGYWRSQHHHQTNGRQHYYRTVAMEQPLKQLGERVHQPSHICILHMIVYTGRDYTPSSGNLQVVSA